jgi:hypothetical protein
MYRCLEGVLDPPPKKKKKKTILSQYCVKSFEAYFSYLLLNSSDYILLLIIFSDGGGNCPQYPLDPSMHSTPDTTASPVCDALGFSRDYIIIIAEGFPPCYFN